MNYTIHNTDCLDWMRQQPDNSIDTILTSPPYNFDMDYNSYDDNIVDYRGWLALWIVEGCRILRSGGRFIINIQPKFSDKKPYHHWIYQHMENAGMLWYGERIWQKNNINGYKGAAGSMGLPSKPYLWYSTEYVQIYSKHSIHRDIKKVDSMLTIPEQVDWARNHIWSIQPARQKDHPAQMPLELATRLLKLFAARTDTVLDPFAGAGTTLLAAKQLGMNSIGCELDADYCSIIHDRLK